MSYLVMSKIFSRVTTIMEHCQNVVKESCQKNATAIRLLRLPLCLSIFICTLNIVGTGSVLLICDTSSVPVMLFILQCFDAVVWVTERASGP